VSITRAFSAGVVGGLVTAILITATHRMGMAHMNMPMDVGREVT
jgi:hypothetical protein